MHRIVRLLTVVGMAAALVAMPATAQAASSKSSETKASDVKISQRQVVLARDVITDGVGTQDIGIQATIHFTLPYLMTGYGELAQAILIDGTNGRPGLYSPNTRKFTSSSPTYQVALEGWFEGNNVCAPDNQCGFVKGYAVVGTPYGGAIFSTQFQSGQGRWGAWNIHTGLFYPSSGWFPTA